MGGIGVALGQLPVAVTPGPGSVQLVACVLVLVCVAIPIIVALVPAAVSSECDQLLVDLNELRPDGDSTTHARALELEVYLTNANGGHRFGQGVGFLMFGTVLSRRTLKKAAVGSYAILVPTVTYLLSAPLESAATSTDDGGAGGDGSQATTRGEGGT